MTDEEVFDAESEEVNAPMDGEFPGMPDYTPYTPEELEEFYVDGFIWGQEDMGDRKYIRAWREDEETVKVEIDGKDFSPKEIKDILLEAMVAFGEFELAVDEYKDGNKKKWAISQAILFGGKDLSRTIAEVRISAARQIYGYLVNRGAGDRFMLLNTAKNAVEKKALENPCFFNYNHGYHQD